MADRGDATTTPVRSEATGLLLPEGKSEAAEHLAPRPARNRIEELFEAALLGYAATVPISLAVGQMLLGVFLVAWLVAWRRGVVPGPRWRTAGIPLLLVFTGEILAALLNRAPDHLADPFHKHGVLVAIPALAALASARPLFYRRVVGLAAASGAVVAFYAIWQHFTGVDVLRNRALEPYSDGAFVATGTFGHHLTYGGSVMLALLAAVGLAARGRSLRGLPALLVVPLGFGLLWSYARSAWCGAAVGLVALLVGRRGRRQVLGFAIIGVAAGVVALSFDPTVRYRVEEAFKWQGMPPRLRLWQASVRMLADHPMGIGPGRFGTLFTQYWTPGRIHSTVHAHSDLLRAALDGGPLGVAGYLGLVAGAIVYGVRGLRRREQRADLTADEHSNAAARRDLLGVALAGSAAFLVAGIFQTYFWDQEDVMLWLLIAAPAFSAPAARNE